MSDFEHGEQVALLCWVLTLFVLLFAIYLIHVLDDSTEKCDGDGHADSSKPSVTPPFRHFLDS